MSLSLNIASVPHCTARQAMVGVRPMPDDALLRRMFDVISREDNLVSHQEPVACV